MKVLIGTPVHESKDYAMERWLQNVSKLRAEYPADLLMVDNSPGLEYVEKVERYCKKYGINPVRNRGRSPRPISNGTSYTIKHLELPADQGKFERLARSREIIRQKVISENYDAWFSWESDQLIPTNALAKLVRLMKSGNFMVADHQCWMRGYSGAYCTDFGIALVAKEALERYSFILQFGTDPEMPGTWEPSEAWFKRRIIRDGGSCIEVDGIIKPIYHLDK